MIMSQETVDGAVQISMKQNLGCSTKKDESVSETVITIPEELPDLNCSSYTVESAAESDSRESCATANLIEEKLVGDKDEKKSWVVDVKCGDEEICEWERVCRICHLNSEQPLKLASSMVKTDLKQLGCACKGELSVAHSHCAEAWFKLKGNRICEICGQMVNNVRGVGSDTFMEEWKENRSDGNTTESLEASEEEGCWHGQPLCNFLMACLVIAFILPWFFRINFW